MPTGTTIVCIFPKAQLVERGNEAIAFREMLLNIFGLQCIFNYPGKGLFESDQKKHASWLERKINLQVQ